MKLELWKLYPATGSKDKPLTAGALGLGAVGALSAMEDEEEGMGGKAEEDEAGSEEGQTRVVDGSASAG